MKTNAELIGKKIYNELGNLERIDWSWEGGEIAFLDDNQIFRLDALGSIQMNGNTATVGPFRLRFIVRQENPPYGFYVIRDGFRACIRQRIYPLRSAVDLVYRRLIITAAVWGLADFSAGLIPTWKDVYLLKKIADKIKSRESDSEMPPNLGDKAICKMCKKEIEYIGPYWRHTGELQPRHPAIPVEQE